MDRDWLFQIERERMLALSLDRYKSDSLAVTGSVMRSALGLGTTAHAQLDDATRRALAHERIFAGPSGTILPDRERWLATGAKYPADHWHVPSAYEMVRRNEEALLLANKVYASLPNTLATYQSEIPDLANRLLGFDFERQLVGDLALTSFASATATANAFLSATRVDSDLIEVTREFSALKMPNLGSLNAHREFLDAAGLVLPRWPRLRILSHAEKRQRVRKRVQSIKQPIHIGRAKGLVFKYERFLRDIIDEVMEVRYGQDWPRERLPICSAQKLLGRVAICGGNPLEYADFAHYRMIMCHPEHFEAVFSVAFEDVEALAALINKIGDLRARSHHGRHFTPEDLREMRIAFSTLEAGLAALVDSVDVDFQGEW